ncbi:MAG: hypothetical protein H0U64_09725 [Gemmatimonadaceae bacterium]|nr:hypothetical protein [Gemmatimonadaceae bacterium]
MATLWHDSDRKSLLMLQQRNPSGLIGSWIGGLALSALIFWFSKRAPAFEDLLAPIYWIVGIILVAFTLKWVRTRNPQDRRGDDRRRTSRREIE